MWIRNIFKKKDKINIKEEIVEDSKKEDRAFTEYIRDIESEETKILKLQKDYNSGKIKEEELTKGQLDCLCNLYDKQIAKLKKENDLKKGGFSKFSKNKLS